MKLRDYQQKAVTAVYKHLREKPESNPCIVLPTGAGKTPVLASICADVVNKWGGRVLVLAHVKELLKQAQDTIREWFPDLDVGVYSAGLGRRDKTNDVLIGGIQSVHKRANELTDCRPFNVVLIDECHRIPESGDGMYQSMLQDLRRLNPRVRLIGLTATDYRLGTGRLCGDKHLLDSVCYEANVKDLVDQGYLCPVRAKAVGNSADMSGVRLVRGEFSESQMTQAFDEVIDEAIEEVLERGEDRKSCLVFTSAVIHAEMVATALEEAGESVRLITGETPAAERAESIDAFKSGRVKWMVNVNVLTEGFDAKMVDLVVLLRATTSPGLYYQMVGRGLRLHPDKQDCLLLDYGKNVARHGPIDAIDPKRTTGGGGAAPMKICPECKEEVAISNSECPECGHHFVSEPTANLTSEADNEEVISSDSPKGFAITRVTYRVHTKKGAGPDDPRTMRVTYYAGLLPVCSEWICIEHSGYAWEKARDWWITRTGAPMPYDASKAVQAANRGELAEPTVIRVRRNRKTGYKEVVGYDLAPVKFMPDEELPF